MRRIRVEVLANHQHRFAVFVHSFVEKCDVRRQRHVAGHFLPHELERIAAEPHILAAAGNRVAAFCGIVFRGTFMQNRPDVTVPFEDARRRGSFRPGACKSVCAGQFGQCAVFRRGHESQSRGQCRQPEHFLSVHGELLHSLNRRATLGCSLSIVNSSALRGRTWILIPFPQPFPFSLLACYLRRLRGSSMSVNKVTIRQGSSSRGASRRGISARSNFSSEGEFFHVSQ